jgi:hypothetical protein
LRFQLQFTAEDLLDILGCEHRTALLGYGQRSGDLNAAAATAKRVHRRRQQRCNTPHRCFERVKSLLGVGRRRHGVTEDEPLPNLLPGARTPLDVLLTGDPPTVNEDVALMEHKMGP